MRFFKLLFIKYIAMQNGTQNPMYAVSVLSEISFTDMKNPILRIENAIKIPIMIICHLVISFFKMIFCAIVSLIFDSSSILMESNILFFVFFIFLISFSSAINLSFIVDSMCCASLMCVFPLKLSIIFAFHHHLN